MQTQKTVCGMYKSQRQIDSAVEELRAGKFKISNLAIVMPSGSRSENNLPNGSSTILTRSFESILADVIAHEPLPGAQDVLTSLGISKSNAGHYEERLKDGDFLLSVPISDLSSSDSAKQILRRTGAEDVTTTSDKNFSSEQIH